MKILHFMSDDLLPRCGSSGDETGVAVTPVESDVECNECRRLLAGAEALPIEERIPDTLDALAIVLGQMDGKTFIPEEALRMLIRRKAAVSVWRDEIRHGWWVRLDSGSGQEIDGPFLSATT